MTTSLFEWGIAGNVTAQYTEVTTVSRLHQFHFSLTTKTAVVLFVLDFQIFCFYLIHDVSRCFAITTAQNPNLVHLTKLLTTGNS